MQISIICATPVNKYNKWEGKDKAELDMEMLLSAQRPKSNRRRAVCISMERISTLKAMFFVFFTSVLSLQ